MGPVERRVVDQGEHRQLPQHRPAPRECGAPGTVPLAVDHGRENMIHSGAKPPPLEGASLQGAGYSSQTTRPIADHKQSTVQTTQKQKKKRERQKVGATHHPDGHGVAASDQHPAHSKANEIIQRPTVPVTKWSISSALMHWLTSSGGGALPCPRAAIENIGCVCVCVWSWVTKKRPDSRAHTERTVIN